MQKKYIESNSESFFINIIITIVVNNNTQYIAEFTQLINVNNWLMLNTRLTNHKLDVPQR